MGGASSRVQRGAPRRLLVVATIVTRAARSAATQLRPGTPKSPVESCVHQKVASSSAPSSSSSSVVPLSEPFWSASWRKSRRLSMPCV
eukprot:3675577-Prymnesium_polylepis.2